MFRITIYESGRDPEKQEIEEDFDELTDIVDSCMRDIKDKVIRGFTVSKVKG
jgi:hypothetical protein